MKFMYEIYLLMHTGSALILDSQKTFWNELFLNSFLLELIDMYWKSIETILIFLKLLNHFLFSN